jgi:hypothetical protein
VAWAGLSHAGHGPEDVEEIARVSGVPLRSVRGDAHAREELRAFGFTEQAEEHRNHAALAVVLVVLDPRMMIAVRNRSFADVEAQQSALRSMARSTAGSFTPASRASTSEIVRGTPGEFIMP